MTASSQNGIGDFLRDVINDKPEKEAGGFLVPKEMIPGARIMMGLCPKCGHEWPDDKDECPVCGTLDTDEITVEDVEEYDGKRSSN